MSKQNPQTSVRNVNVYLVRTIRRGRLSFQAKIHTTITFNMTSSYLLYQTSSPSVERIQPTIVTRTDINMPGFSQKPYNPFTQNDTPSSIGFQPPPPTRRPPPVPMQQQGMTISSFSQRPLEIPPTADVNSPAFSQASSRNNSDLVQQRNNSAAQSSAGTNGSNEAGGRSPSVFAALMGRAPRMTKSTLY